MTIHRRDFLSSLGGVAVSTTLKSTPFAETWDVSWTDRVKGKYRAVFDSPGFSDGGALYRTFFWLRQYKEVYGAAPEEMSAILVVRHEGIWLAMDDAFWKKYEVGKRFKFKDGKKGWFTRNPIVTASPGLPPDMADNTIPKFISGGGIVLACNMAFRGVVSVVEEQDKLKTPDAENLAKNHLVPGVIMQPSGVFAVIRSQEAGCHYILAG